MGFFRLVFCEKIGVFVPLEKITLAFIAFMHFDQRKSYTEGDVQIHVVDKIG